jgi:hypothetical protein
VDGRSFFGSSGIFGKRSEGHCEDRLKSDETFRDMTSTTIRTQVAMAPTILRISDARYSSGINLKIEKETFIGLKVKMKLTPRMTNPVQGNIHKTIKRIRKTFIRLRRPMEETSIPPPHTAATNM